MLGPVGWRKLQSWRATKRTEAALATTTRPSQRTTSLLQLPRPLLLPSNALLSAIVTVLIAYNVDALVRALLGRDLQDADVFLVSGTGTRASVAEVRSRVASMTWSELGWRNSWGEEGLEVLLRRLTSYEGRRLHLLVGTAPLLECRFCSTASDLALFSLANRLVQYSTHLFLFGLLTLRCDSLEMIDEVCRSLGLMQSRHVPSSPIAASSPTAADGASSSAQPVRLHRAHWRQTAMYMLGAMLLVECAILFDWLDLSFGHGEGGRSRWNHWHANLHLARHLIFLVLSLAIYLRPTLPRTPSLVAAAMLLGQIRANLEETMTQVQTTRLSNDVVWSDVGLRTMTGQWWDKVVGSERNTPLPPPPSSSSGGSTTADVMGMMQARARATAAKIWAEVERNWARWAPRMVNVASKDHAAQRDSTSSKAEGVSGVSGREGVGSDAETVKQQKQPSDINGALQESQSANQGVRAQDQLSNVKQGQVRTGEASIQSSGP